jgi:hypothetical protein
MFYEFNHETQTESCYDENANLKEQITLNLKGLDKFLRHKMDVAFIFHNGALLIQSHAEKKVIEIFFE